MTTKSETREEETMTSKRAIVYFERSVLEPANGHRIAGVSSKAFCLYGNDLIFDVIHVKTGMRLCSFPDRPTAEKVTRKWWRSLSKKERWSIATLSKQRIAEAALGIPKPPFVHDGEYLAETE